jgi:hypothetical protein
MDGEAAYVGASPLDLAAVQSATDFHAHAAEPIAKSKSTPDRSGGSVERGDQPISRCLHERPTVSSKLPLGQRIVRVEDVPPTMIAKLRGPLRRADDVGEQDRRQHAVRVNGCSRPREELLDLVDDGIHVAKLQAKVRAWEFDEPGPFDVLGQVPSVSIVKNSVSRRCMTSVGTRMLGRIGRMSSWSSIRMTAAAVAGLAARRMYLATSGWILGSRARLGLFEAANSAVPHVCSTSPISISCCSGGSPIG